MFEEGTFVPAAKLTERQKLSIATNYLGTPEAMYREDGEAVWTCELNSYGRVRNYQGESKTECPFRYQGQYEDVETGLYYNRFRYYDSETGSYISQDPIGLEGENPTFYGYVWDTNSELDFFGLRNTELYYLKASKDGYYNVYEKGSKNPTGKTYLKEGEIWKIGESYNPEKRYSQAYLQREGVIMDANKGRGSKTNIHKTETNKLKKYQKRRGKLPPGNKVCH